MEIWDGYLKDGQEQKFAYYLRLEGSPDGFSGKVKVLDGYSNEFAVIVDPVTEKELEEMLETAPFAGHTVLGKIRVI